MLSKKKKKLLFMGAIIGLVNGIFGGGGGIVAVNMLSKNLGYEQKESHATSIFIMLPTSIVSAFVYLIGGHFPIFSGSLITFGVVIGGLIGAFLLKIISQEQTKYTFLFLMFFSGIKLLFL